MSGKEEFSEEVLPGPLKDFKLIPWQIKVEKAIRHGAKKILIKAGRKSGKTEYVRYRMLKDAYEPPKSFDQLNVYVAPARVHAKNILWRRLKAAIPREDLENKPRETDLAIDMKNGTRMQLFGAENEDSLRGLIFGRSVIDEADFIRSGFYDEIFEPNMAVLDERLLMTSTPTNRWFTKMWRQAKAGEIGRHVAAFHFTIYDNPYITRSFIEKTRRQVSSEVWEQEYMANENAYSGLMYHEFKNSHIVKPRNPDTTRLLCRGMDWGMDHPSACLWGELLMNPATHRWNLYIWREFSIRGQAVEELVKPILAGDSNHYYFTVIDSSAKRTEMGTGNSILTELRRHGLSCRVPSGTDAYRINAVKMMLKNDDITISENCPMLIKQLREVEWDQKKGDDAADAFKYLCSMIYSRDFSSVEANGTAIGQEKTDPTGLIAALENRESMQWSETLQ